MNWYTKTKKDNLQGLVIDEETGQNIAVTYDPAHAQIVAAAPELLELARQIILAFEIEKARIPADILDSAYLIIHEVDGQDHEL